MHCPRDHERGAVSPLHFMSQKGLKHLKQRAYCYGMTRDDHKETGMPSIRWGLSTFFSFADRSSASIAIATAKRELCENKQRNRTLVELAKNITITEESILLVFNLEGSASVLGKEDAIANLAIHGNQLSVAVQSAGADSQNLGVMLKNGDYSSLVGLGDRSLRQQNTGGSLHTHSVPLRKPAP